MRIRQHGKNLVIDPPHNQVILAFSRELPGRRRWKDGALWIEGSGENIRFLVERFPQVKTLDQLSAVQEQLTVDEQAPARQPLPPEAAAFMFKTAPYQHQLEAFGLARNAKEFGFLMEQGTGKSKVLIDNAASLYADGEIERVVVLAPNGVHYQWVDEQLPLHMPDHLSWDGIAYNPKAGRREMAEWDRRALGGTESLQWMTMAYQSLSMSEKAKKKFLAAITGRTMLILDESHNIKNHSAKRTQFILKHREYAEYRRIATGTPITQGLEDLYTQFRFLNPRIIGHNTFTSFRSQYCRTMPIPGAPAGAVRIIGYQNVDELRSRIKGYSYEVLKEDCLDLPDKVYQQRYVELTVEQAKHYKTLKEDLLAQINDGTIVEAPLALTQLVKLQQVLCGHVIDAEGVTHPVPSNRIQAVKDILEEKKRAIVWARFRYDIRTLHEELTKEGYNCGMYYGDTSESERERLRKPGEVDILIANPQSAGTGLNLTHFDTAIYYSNSFDAALRWQSEDRIHRIGQNNHCTYVDLVAPRTLDVKIVDALRKKKAVASTIQEVKTALS